MTDFFSCNNMYYNCHYSYCSPLHEESSSEATAAYYKELPFSMILKAAVARHSTHVRSSAQCSIHET